MQAAIIETRIGQLPALSRAGKRINGLHRLMRSSHLYELAYQRVSRNRGALTPGVDGATFDGMREVDGRLQQNGVEWAIEADTVLKAIGQTLLLADPTLATLGLRSGRIAVDEEGRTSLAKVWAGGDCTHGGLDLTVEAVEHGKIAAHSIDRALGVGHRSAAFRRVRKPTA